MTFYTNLSWSQEINIFSSPTTENATTYTIANTDGLTSTVFHGTFNLSGGHVVSGQISEIDLVANSGGTILQTITNGLGDIGTQINFANQVSAFRQAHQPPWASVLPQNNVQPIFSPDGHDVTITNTDGTFTDIHGTGLAQIADATFSGTVTDILHLASDGTTVLGDSIHGLNDSMNLVAAAFGSQTGSSQYYQLATSGNNTMTGLVGIVPGSNFIYGSIDASAGNDTINGAAFLPSDPTVRGVYYGSATSAVQVDLNTGLVTGGSGNDTLNGNIDAVGGSRYNDILTGNSLFNTLFGQIGDDTISGGGGNDVLDGGLGNDIIDGGTGTNTAEYQIDDQFAGSGVTVALNLGAGGGGGIAQNTGSQGTDTLSNIQNLIGTQYNDTLTGDANNNTLTGNQGNDTLTGGAGTNTLDGGPGHDVAMYGFASTLAGITHNANGSVTITGPSTTDTLIAVEVAHFTDRTIALHTRHDFNDDGTADVLFANPTTGGVGEFAMSNGQATSWGGIGATSTNWSIVGIGNFNGNGTADILFRDATTGGVGEFVMNNGQATGWVGIGATSTDWTVAGTGDFNGDGTNDILFRNATTGGIGEFVMNNNNQATAWAGIGATSTDWSVVGAGDFNGDGTADILLRNATTGGIGQFVMNNGQPTWAGIGATSTDWNVVGTGDFNGDGTTDILFRNATTGAVGEFLMNNGQATWATAGTTSTDWNTVRTGDYNGDGTTDILFGNSTTGGVGEFVMNNGQATSWVGVGSTSTDWHLAT